MPKTWESIQSALRDCVLFCGKSYTQIARENGISRPTLYRLIAGQSITLRHIEKLVRYFKLVVVSEQFEDLKRDRT